MSSIPLDARETLVFTPDACAGLAPAPVFVLRTATRRDRRAFEGWFAARYPHYSQEKMRSEQLIAIEKLFDVDDAAANSQILKDCWAAGEAFDEVFTEWLRERDLWVTANPNAEKLPDDFPPRPIYDYPMENAGDVLVGNIRANWPVLQAMAEANILHTRTRPRMMLATVLASWEGLDVAPERDRDGRLTADCIDAIEDALADLGGEGVAAAAMGELTAKAFERIYLTRGLEKNLPSPLPSTPIPTPISTDGESSGGTSPASASSPKTRAKSSPTTAGN